MYDESEVAKKAKNIRYKKGALELVQREYLDDAISKIYDDCYYLLYEEDESALLEALGQDENELDQIKFCLIDLMGNCETLYGCH